VESRRHLLTEVHSVLEYVYTSAGRAHHRAQATRAAGEQAVEHELMRLAILRREIEDLLTDTQ
jgi:hypothetical protein